MENELQPHNESQNGVDEQPQSAPPKNKSMLAASIFISAFMLSGAWIYAARLKNPPEAPDTAQVSDTIDIHGDAAKNPQKGGTVLPVRWGDTGKKLVDAGVIDAVQFEAVYQNRGGLNETEKQLLYGSKNGNLAINAENSGIILNLLWAFGLGNKNPILEQGPMMDPQYGGAGNFASTGGWTIAKGNPMEHYAKHPFIVLTAAQQALVERVAKNIYRPCCDNPTYFPDCNHGMAMLGLLELMAAQGVNEAEMYRAALTVNSYWFPDVYETIKRYFEAQGIAWDAVDPKQALGAAFSSGSGFQRIQSLVPASPQKGGGGGCGIDSGNPVPQQNSGCGVE